MSNTKVKRISICFLLLFCSMFLFACDNNTPVEDIHFADESIVLRVFFHRHHFIASSRQEFDADASGSGKQVERRYAVLKIEIIVQYVEKVFFGKVGRRACLEALGHIEPPVFVNSTDYSHINKD